MPMQTSADRRQFFERYRGSIAYVEVERSSGTISIGTAFHVGDGVFVTARHVVEGNSFVRMSTTEDAYVPSGSVAGVRDRGIRGGEKFDVVRPRSLTVRSGPHLHPEPRVDVAVIATNGLSEGVPAIQLGGHLDDWIGRSDFVLSEAIVLGYPPIPLDKEPRLVALRTEVIAQVDPYDRPHVHFVLGAMPRGGLSGGLAWSEWGFALGLITDSLVRDNNAVELGYLCVVTVEPIYDCLEAHELLPASQTEWLREHPSS